MVFKIVFVGLALFIALVLWRLFSVGRGMRQRDRKLFARLDPVASRLEAGDAVAPAEIDALAAQHELRFLLFNALRHLGKSELLPARFNSTEAQGEAALAYWMTHPNELQAPPEQIECIATFPRVIDAAPGIFHVYRYRMPAGHWAANDGWLLGLAGPLQPDAEPYAALPGAFSRVNDHEGQISPADLVAWYLDMLRQKGLVKTVT